MIKQWCIFCFKQELKNSLAKKEKSLKEALEKEKAKSKELEEQLDKNELDDPQTIFTAQDWESLTEMPGSADFFEYAIALPHSRGKDQYLIAAGAVLLMKAMKTTDIQDIRGGGQEVLMRRIKSWNDGYRPFAGTSMGKVFINFEIEDPVVAWCINTVLHANAKPDQTPFANPQAMLELMAKNRDEAETPALSFNLEERAELVGFAGIPKSEWPAETSLRDFVHKGRHNARKGLLYAGDRIGDEGALAKQFGSGNKATTKQKTDDFQANLKAFVMGEDTTETSTSYTLELECRNRWLTHLLFCRVLTAAEVFVATTQYTKIAREHNTLICRAYDQATRKELEQAAATGAERKELAHFLTHVDAQRLHMAIIKNAAHVTTKQPRKRKEPEDKTTSPDWKKPRKGKGRGGYRDSWYKDYSHRWRKDSWKDQDEEQDEPNTDPTEKHAPTK